LSAEADNPWLHVTAADYEGHMNAVGQAAILRAMFFRIYAERQPKRLAVLGCTTGGDLQLVDPATTKLAFGVDINAAYLEIARDRLAALGARLQLIEGDVLRVDLPPGQFDLVHVALLLEYIEPLSLFRRAHEWLAPGGACSVITQSPQPGVRAVTETGFRTIQLLTGKMRLRDERQVATLARQCGFSLLREPVATSVGGKILVCSVFRK
jgi:SAM-dependent methyltransferase